MLSDLQILAGMDAGDIVISPFDRRQLGVNSYDVRLGSWFCLETVHARLLYDPFDPTNADQVASFWDGPVHSEEGVLIRPGTTILAHTREFIGAHRGYVCSMRARSSIGRSALSVCKCSGLADLGYVSRWTMEISNHSKSVIVLPVGLRVAQIEFHEAGEASRSYLDGGKYGHALNEASWSPHDMLPKLSLDWDLAEVRQGKYR